METEVYRKNWIRIIAVVIVVFAAIILFVGIALITCIAGSVYLSFAIRALGYYPNSVQVNDLNHRNTSKLSISHRGLNYLSYSRYSNADNLTQVDSWYKQMGWKNNLEDGGLIKDTRTKFLFIQGIMFHRVFISAVNDNSTTIKTEIMIVVYASL